MKPADLLKVKKELEKQVGPIASERHAKDAGANPSGGGGGAAASLADKMPVAHPRNLFGPRSRSRAAAAGAAGAAAGGGGGGGGGGGTTLGAFAVGAPAAATGNLIVDGKRSTLGAAAAGAQGGGRSSRVVRSSSAPTVISPVRVHAAAAAAAALPSAASASQGRGVGRGGGAAAAAAAGGGGGGGPPLGSAAARRAAANAMRPLRGDDAALNLRDPAGQLLARDARPLNSGATCDVWGYTYPHGTAMAGTRVAVKRIQHGRLPHQCRNNREDLTRLAKAMVPEGGLIPTEVTNAGSQETALIMEIGTDMVRVSVRAVPIVCVNACLCVSVSLCICVSVSLFLCVCQTWYSRNICASVRRCLSLSLSLSCTSLPHFPSKC